jgi:O-antigen/teichoic acid export membrane protein
MAQNDAAECQRVFSTALRAYLCIAGCVIVGGAILASLAPLYAKTASDAVIFGRLILISSVTIALGFPARTFIGALNAALRYDMAAALEILLLLLRSGGTIFALLAGYGVLGMAISSLCCTFPWMALGVYFTRREYPFLRLHVRKSACGAGSALFSYSVYSFLARVADLLRYQMDAVVISAFIGLSAVTHYRMAANLAMPFIEVVLAATGTLQTLFSRLEGRHDLESVQRVLLLGTKISIGISSFVAFGLIAWGKPFIVRWMGPNYVDAYPCLVALVVGLMAALWQAPSVSMLFGVSRHRFYAILCCGEGLANLCLSILLARKYGILGVALGTMIPMVLSKLVVQPVYVCRVVELDYRTYIGKVLRNLGAAAVSLIVPYAITVAIVGPDISALVLTGSLSALTYLPLLWLLMFSKEERGILRAALPAPWGRRVTAAANN